jgi:predicted RNase H-like HicB family nuclease
MAKYFTLEYWRDEGWYVGRLKEVPGVFSQGQTLEELKENILDAYNLMIEEEEEALPNMIKDKVKQIRVEI